MRYAISTALLVDPEVMDLLTILDRIHASGFRMVELSCPYIEQVRWVTSHIDEVRSSLESLGIEIVSGHSPCVDVDIAADDESVRQQAVAETVSAIQTFSKLGIENVVVHPNGHRHEGYTTHTAGLAQIQARRSLVELAEIASKNRVRLAVENIQSYGTPRPGCRAEDLLELIEGLGEHVGMCIDTSHARMSGHEPDKHLVIAGDTVFMIHINDTDGVRDPHWLPGHGVINWDKYHHALESIKFNGIRVLELESDPHHIDQVLADAYKLAMSWSLRPVVKQNAQVSERRVHSPSTI